MNTDKLWRDYTASGKFQKKSYVEDTTPEERAKDTDINLFIVEFDVDKNTFQSNDEDTRTKYTEWHGTSGQYLTLPSNLSREEFDCALFAITKRMKEQIIELIKGFEMSIQDTKRFKDQHYKRIQESQKSKK